MPLGITAGVIKPRSSSVGSLPETVTEAVTYTIRNGQSALLIMLCAVLQGHYSAVTSLCLAPDGWSLISAGRDKVVHVWDLRKNTKLVTIPVYEALEGDTHTLQLLLGMFGNVIACSRVAFSFTLLIRTRPCHSLLCFALLLCCLWQLPMKMT